MSAQPIEQSTGPKVPSNASKGDRAFIATRIPASDKPRLVQKAHDTGLSVSEYLDQLIADDLRTGSAG